MATPVSSVNGTASPHYRSWWQQRAVLLACMSAGASAIIGDWVDQTGSFYQGSTISITEGGWTVTPPSYTDGDTLSLEKIGDAYSLTEHDGTRLDGT